MQNRPTRVVSWRSLGLLGLLGLLVLPMTLLIGAPALEGTRSKKDVRVITPGGVRDERGPGIAEAELRFLDKTRRQTYARPDWWPYDNGNGLRAYGHVSPNDIDSPYVLVLPNDKGSIDTRKSKVRESLPSELRSHNANARNGYFIVQLAASQSGKGALEMRKVVESRGGEIIDYVPNNAYLVRIDAKSRPNFDDTSVFQYVSAYNAADKIHPTVGTKGRLNPEYASSDTFKIVVRVMEGEDPAGVADEVERLGGTVTQTHEVTGVNYVSAELRNNRVVELARNSAVRTI